MMRRIPLPRPLPEAEVKLFDFVVNAVKHLDVTLRVAGGWVRDQMLNRPSDDIDITIETPQGRNYITGEQLAIVLAEATEAVNFPRVSVIKTNPEKSKHIETAQVTIMGHHLEFCHLRKDDYTQCSPVMRTPTVTAATPREDAERRDFCCNALFYNLHTREVEDFVGGLDDVRDRVLRCPLDPYETFSDDPLRMLRGIRFAGKLGFAIHPSVSETIVRGHEIHEPGFFTHEWKDVAQKPLVWELLRKVSRERCGIEVSKMLSGPRPVMCAELLARHGLLYSTVILEMVPAKTKKGASADYDRIAMVVPRELWDEVFFRHTASVMKVAFADDTENHNQLRLDDNDDSAVNNNSNASDAASSSCSSREESSALNSPHDRLVIALYSLLAAPTVTMRNTITTAIFGHPVAPPESPLFQSISPGMGGRTAAGAHKHPVVSHRDEIIKRSEAIIQNGLKLPRKVAEEVGTLLLALESLESGIPLIQQGLRECDDPAVAPMRFVGNLRAAMFQALRTIRNSSLPVTVAFLRVVGAIAVDGDEAPARHFVKSLMHDEPLFKCGALMPLIKGDEIVAKILPALTRAKVGEVLTTELQFLVDHPNATSAEVAAYLVSVYGNVGLPPQQQQQQHQQDNGSEDGAAASS